ncbi:SDR family NAD(P)-dependent oxidoreductase [Allonocardiopsis opalescens]|uniref:Gluconate 5-dehydrogenase n=1 Tax=Allonocardiopsis opalescens TaxID=1144618 RepID=A0A2T0Q4V7_9ACTN|nr:SDR family oxidoreductase [Allonocardiopsis opalescens]PRX98836.1 gluconate 5-dehydrogenase [Allonocardiopsis opalescens]
MSTADYLADLFSLRDRAALVTGGNSGIGRAIAGALAGAGASVVVSARNEANLAATVAELTGAGLSAAAVPADLGERAQVRRLAERAAEPFGEIDILVNCGAVNIRPPLAELTEEQWDRTMAVNLDAPFLLGQHFGPRMAARGWGRIINIASQQAFRAFSDSGAYGAAKSGLVALTRSQAEAWSPHGVACNCVSPGVVATPLNERLFADPGTAERLAARTLTGRNGETADFRGPVVFLASSAADYVTGQNLFVDGGFSAH